MNVNSVSTVEVDVTYTHDFERAFYAAMDSGKWDELEPFLRGMNNEELINLRYRTPNGESYDLLSAILLHGPIHFIEICWDCLHNKEIIRNQMICPAVYGSIRSTYFWEMVCVSDNYDLQNEMLDYVEEDDLSASPSTGTYRNIDIIRLMLMEEDDMDEPEFLQLFHKMVDKLTKPHLILDCPDTLSNQGMTILTLACQGNHYDLVSKMLALIPQNYLFEPAKGNASDCGNPLWYAFLDEKEAICKKILSFPNASPNFIYNVPRNKNDLLLQAIYFNYDNLVLEMVEFLKKHKPNFALFPEIGGNALSAVCCQTNYSLLEKLLPYCKEPSKKQVREAGSNTDKGINALLALAIDQEWDWVDRLIPFCSPAGFSYYIDDGDTALRNVLYFAVSDDRRKTINLILDKCSKDAIIQAKSTRDLCMYSPLDVALRNDDEETLTLMMKKFSGEEGEVVESLTNLGVDKLVARYASNTDRHLLNILCAIESDRWDYLSDTTLDLAFNVALNKTIEAPFLIQVLQKNLGMLEIFDESFFPLHHVVKAELELNPQKKIELFKKATLCSDYELCTEEQKNYISLQLQELEKPRVVAAAAQTQAKKKNVPSNQVKASVEATKAIEGTLEAKKSARSNKNKRKNRIKKLSIQSDPKLLAGAAAVDQLFIMPAFDAVVPIVPVSTPDMISAVVHNDNPQFVIKKKTVPMALTFIEKSYVQSVLRTYKGMENCLQNPENIENGMMEDLLTFYVFKICETLQSEIPQLSSSFVLWRNWIRHNPHLVSSEELLKFGINLLDQDFESLLQYLLVDKAFQLAIVAPPLDPTHEDGPLAIKARQKIGLEAFIKRKAQILFKRAESLKNKTVDFSSPEFIDLYKATQGAILLVGSAVRDLRDEHGVHITDAMQQYIRFSNKFAHEKVLEDAKSDAFKDVISHEEAKLFLELAGKISLRTRKKTVATIRKIQ